MLDQGSIGATGHAIRGEIRLGAEHARVCGQEEVDDYSPSQRRPLITLYHTLDLDRAISEQLDAIMPASSELFYKRCFVFIVVLHKLLTGSILQTARERDLFPETKVAL